MMGLSTMGSISFGCALVAGRKRVPRPAAGKTALRTLASINSILVQPAPVGNNEYLTVLGKPGTASQFQRRELVAVPVLRRIGYVRNFSKVRGLYAQWNSSS